MRQFLRLSLAPAGLRVQAETSPSLAHLVLVEVMVSSLLWKDPPKKKEILKPLQSVRKLQNMQDLTVCYCFENIKKWYYCHY